ncbi:MAG: RNA-directed DNA polymerase [Bacteroidota bacterium]
MKQGTCSLTAALSLLFNLSWETGETPSQWKLANVVALYKGKGDRADPSHYRPISLTSVVARLFERVILRRLTAHLEAGNVLSHRQAGFRRSFSTVDQLFHLRVAIQKTYSKHSFLPIAFLDIVKAYDRTWRDGLLLKLHRAGVCGASLRWIHGFLTDRSFRVVQQSSASSWQPLCEGLPQSSVLSPILFLIFINDIDTCLTEHCEMGLFADDLVVRPTVPGRRVWKPLQSTLKNVSEWAKRWRVEFSVAKSNLVVFTRRRRALPPRPVLLDGVPLAEVGEFRYLGLTFQRDGRWSSHVGAIRKQMTSAGGMIGRITGFGRPPWAPVIRTLVISMVYSRCLYGLPVWSPETKDQIRALVRLICGPLQRCLGLPASAHQASMLAEFGLPDVEKVVEAALLRFGARCSSLPDTHPLSIAFRHCYDAASPPRPEAAVARPLTCRIKSVEAAWGVTLQDVAYMGKRAGFFNKDSMVVTRSHADWLAQPSGKSLKRVKRVAGMSGYLYHDSKFVATHRARLRFGVGTQVTFHRFNSFNSQDCPFCPGTTETADHLLLECPAYASARSRCLLEIEGVANECPHPSPDMSSSSPYLLGGIDQLTPRLASPILRSSARFLRDLFCRRTTQRKGWKISFPFAMEGAGDISPAQQILPWRRLRLEAPPFTASHSVVPAAVLAAAGTLLSRARR